MCLRFQEGRLGHDGHTQLPCRFNHADSSTREGFDHAEIERKLNESEAMVRAAFLSGDLREPPEAEGAFFAEAVPCGGAIPADLLLSGKRLEPGKSAADTFFETGVREETQLGFGIVQVEDINGIHA